MKNFTTSDVENSHIYAESTDDLILAPLWWHLEGLSQTVSGYGGKLTSRYKISFEGKNYRLYISCFSNASSTWFSVKGKKYFVD
jgi:hypothetical protein